MQTFVAHKAIAGLQDRFDGRIDFSSVAIQPFNTLVITDLTLIDENPWTDPSVTPADTILKAGTLSARFTLTGLLSRNGIRIKKLDISDAALTLVAEPGDIYKNNISRVFHLVKKEKEKSKMKSCFALPFRKSMTIPICLMMYLKSFM